MQKLWTIYPESAEKQQASLQQRLQDQSAKLPPCLTPRLSIKEIQGSIE